MRAPRLTALLVVLCAGAALPAPFGPASARPDARPVTADPAAPELTILPLTVAEGDAAAVARVGLRLSAPFATAQEVVVATARGAGPEAATPGVDYHDREQAVPFAPGQLEAELVVPVIDDRLDEPDERFRVFMRPSAVVREPPEQTAVPVTIADDDAPAPVPGPPAAGTAGPPPPGARPVTGVDVRLTTPRLVGRGVVAVRVACAAAGPCSGSARLSIGAAGAASAVRAFRLPDARRRTVRLRLPAPATVRLRAGRTVHVHVSVRVRPPAGAAITRTRSARLRLA